MSTVVIKSDASHVTLSLTQFAMNLKRRYDLNRIIGLGQLKSIYTTFAEGGSPSGSWPALSDASRSWRKYSSGHKLLIDKGLLRNSITYSEQGDSVVIGTGLKYAWVHQDGYSGPQKVRPYSYTRRQRSRDSFRTERIVNKLGRNQTVKRKVSSAIGTVSVKGFTRNINIPARPFLVFRPEDPERIQKQVALYVAEQGKAAGLESR